MKCINIAPMPGNDKAPDLVLNENYTILKEIICACGEHHYDVGLPLLINYVECFKCRQTLTGDIHWCHSSRFQK